MFRPGVAYTASIRLVLRAGFHLDGSTEAVVIPAAGVTAGTVAVAVSPDGAETVLRKSVPAEDGVAVTVAGAGALKLADRGVQFSNVPAGSWAADAAAFVSARQIFNGTAPGVFSPNRPMTRAMLAAVLHNLESNPRAAAPAGFADTPADAWYAGAVAWAAETGIVSGHALEALCWAMGAGVLRGYGDGRLNPGGAAIRAQAAQMVMNFMCR